MFNKKTKSIKRVPTKEEGTRLIGTVINGQLVTNIETTGQVRVLTDVDFDEWKDAIGKWKTWYNTPGLHRHPGQLLTSHESAELYETASEEAPVKFDY